MPTQTIETFDDREALEATRPDLAVLVGAVAAAGFIILRGAVCGIITTTSKLRRRTRAVAAGAGFATNATTGQVNDATVFKAGDVLTNAAGATVGTVANVPTKTAITLTANAAVAVAAGAAVLGSDGSQVAAVISYDQTDGTQDANIAVYITGLLKEAKLIGLDSTAKTELAGSSKVGGIFKF